VGVQAISIDADLIGHPVSKHQRSTGKRDTRPTTFSLGVLVRILSLPACDRWILSDSPSLPIDLIASPNAQHPGDDANNEQQGMKN
jgi:hypothetical protein